MVRFWNRGLDACTNVIALRLQYLCFLPFFFSGKSRQGGLMQRILGRASQEHHELTDQHGAKADQAVNVSRLLRALHYNQLITLAS